MGSNLRHLYEFGHFKLSEMEGLISKEGHVVPLTPKALDLLLALLKGHGRVLTKQELLDTVWPGIVVDDNNLPTQIATLRKAIGPGYVETVSRRGYRFAAEVREKWEDLASPSRPPEDAPANFQTLLKITDLVEVASHPGRIAGRPFVWALLAGTALAVLAMIGLAFRHHGGARQPLARTAIGRFLARATSEGGSFREIKLDHVPSELLITPDGKKLYAFEYYSRLITVLDCSSLKVKSIITLPSTPQSAFMTRDGKRIYVGLLVDGVMVVDSEHDRVLDRRLPTGGTVFGLAVTPDEQKLFLAMGSAGLKRLSLGTGKSRLLSEVACPVSVGIHPDGNELYVSYQCGGPGGRSGHDAVEIYDVNSEKTLATVNGPPMVGGVVSFAPDTPYVLLPGRDACLAPKYDHVGCLSVPSTVYHLLNSADHKVAKTLTMPWEEMMGVFAPAGRRIVFSDKFVSVVDPLRDTLLERYSRVGERYGRAAFAPMGNRMFIPVSPTGLLVLDTLDQRCLPPAQGLFNLYSGDGTLDDERQAQPLVSEGGIEFAPGLIGQAFRFNGKDGPLRARYWGACGGCDASWSESLYVKFAGLEGEMTILERGHYERDPEHRLLKSGNNRITLETGDRLTPGPSISSSGPISAGKWHHLAVVTQGGELRLYIDGNMTGRVKLPPIGTFDASKVPGGAYVGATHKGTNFLNGLVDELAFYNRALSPAEIKAAYELTLHGPCSPSQTQ